MRTQSKSLRPAEISYDGSYVPLGTGGSDATIRPAGPTTEEREQQIAKDLARRGVTYEVDSSEIGDTEPDR